MKYIHNFNTESEFSLVYNSEEYEEPWVSYIKNLERVDYNKRLEFVDLGLPSGTLWAKTNIGAGSPEDVGGFYAWGEISPKSEYTEDNYDSSILNRYNLTTGRIYLTPDDDAVSLNTNGVAHIPTEGQLQELCHFTNYSADEENGVPGFRFESKEDSDVYIFIPFSGLKIDDDSYPFNVIPPEDKWFGLWSNTYDGGMSDYSWALNGDDSENVGMYSFSSEYEVLGHQPMGLPIRAVKEPERTTDFFIVFPHDSHGNMPSDAMGWRGGFFISQKLEPMTINEISGLSISVTYIDANWETGEQTVITRQAQDRKSITGGNSVYFYYDNILPNKYLYIEYRIDNSQFPSAQVWWRCSWGEYAG